MRRNRGRGEKNRDRRLVLEAVDECVLGIGAAVEPGALLERHRQGQRDIVPRHGEESRGEQDEHKNASRRGMGEWQPAAQKADEWREHVQCEIFAFIRGLLLLHSADMSDVTRLIDAAAAGDANAAADLLPLVYDELRRLAAQKLVQEKPGQTLQATALVHEAYLRVVGAENAQRWDSRRHFYAAAAEAMRRILIDQARHKHSVKGGGAVKRRPLDEAGPIRAPEGEPVENLLALDEALRQLEVEDPIKAQLVKLRYFIGASLEETARLLDISPATAKRYWIYARSWLYAKLNEE